MRLGLPFARAVSSGVAVLAIAARELVSVPERSPRNRAVLNATATSTITRLRTRVAKEPGTGEAAEFEGFEGSVIMGYEMSSKESAWVSHSIAVIAAHISSL
jgi:hypothetical protein